jgi:hypothetical protein
MKRIAIPTILAVLVVASLLAAGFWWDTKSAASPATQEVKTLQAGWVNIPWVGPTMPIGQVVGSTLPNVAAVYYLDNSTGGWLRYFPGKPETSNLTMLTFGESYLALLTASITVPWLPEDLIYDMLPSICPLATDTSGICDLIDDLISGLAPTATATPAPSATATPMATGDIVFTGTVVGAPAQECGYIGQGGGCWWTVDVRIDETVKMAQASAWFYEYVSGELVTVVFPERDVPGPDVSVGDYVEVSGQEDMWSCGVTCDAWGFIIWPPWYENNYIRRL